MSDERIIASLLFKFGQKEYLDQLLNEGVLYFNTIEFFRKCEADSGRGDKDEFLFLKMDSCEIYADDKLIGTGDNIRTYSTYDVEYNVNYTHIYCITAFFDDYTFFTSVKAIKSKHLCLKPISTKGAQSLYFRRRRKGGSSSNTTSLVFYNKGQELLKKGSIKDLSSVPFVRGANITPTQVHGHYDLSQQDIMRIEVALNRRKNQHMIPFDYFIRLLHGGHLYKFLAKRYKAILCMYLFYEYNASKHSDAKTLLKEVVLEQGVDIQLFRTLFQFEGVTKTKSQSLDAFLSAITDPYATEILNSL